MSEPLLMCPCGHARIEHAIDLEGPAFCEFTSCDCNGYHGPKPPSKDDTISSLRTHLEKLARDRHADDHEMRHSFDGYTWSVTNTTFEACPDPDCAEARRLLR